MTIIVHSRDLEYIQHLFEGVFKKLNYTDYYFSQNRKEIISHLNRDQRQLLITGMIRGMSTEDRYCHLGSIRRDFPKLVCAKFSTMSNLIGPFDIEIKKEPFDSKFWPQKIEEAISSFLSGTLERKN